MEITLQDILNKLVIDDYFENTNSDIELYSDPSFNSRSIENGNDKKLIIQSIDYLLNNSDLAKSYFTQLATNPNLETIKIKYSSGDFQVQSFSRVR